MLAFRDCYKNIAILIKAKKALVPKSVVYKPPTNLVKLPVISLGLAHIKIIKEIIA